MTPQQRTELLRIARGAIEHELGVSTQPPTTNLDFPRDFGGAFVTLKRAGRLRGCMGTFRPLGSMVETVDHVARISSRQDPRFLSNRVEADELPAIRIEVSVLGTPTPTDDPASLEVGKHGVLIQQGSASGCLLPQVATERGWDAEEFLSQCCAGKAGLAYDAWRAPDTEVQLFTAEIISER